MKINKKDKYKAKNINHIECYIYKLKKLLCQQLF